MIGGAAILALVAVHGLWLLLPLSIAEGPIVSVLAGWLAEQGVFDWRAVLVVVVLGDVLGDALWYALGRHLPRAIPARLRPDEAKLRALVRHFEEKGGRTLLFGKLTHAAGLPILVAAGVARMPFVEFLGWNLLGTLPKSAALVALGWSFGAAWQRIEGGIFWGALGLGALIAMAAAVLWRRKAQAA